jgi:hypothetical protein
MFQRVIHHDWAAIIPIISFVITAGFFVAISIRAIRLKKPEREHLANIPLEDGEVPK